MSDPPGAPVYLDNQYRGITPVTLEDVSHGNHTLELRLKGFEVWTSSGTMVDGGYVKVEATLIPAALP